MTPEPLLAADGLVVELPRERGTARAVDGVSLAVGPGEVVGLVGESGSGKSLTALALVGLLPEGVRLAGGRVVLDGEVLTDLPERSLARRRGAGIAYVPQEPATALNPVMTIGAQIVDVVRAHRRVSRAAARSEAVRALERVGIPDAERRAAEYPHQYSGGMRQRALLAMVLAARPRVLVADEPTTAVDRALESEILGVLRGLVARDGLSVLLISHDLGMVAGVCDRVYVMYAGRIVESGPAAATLAAPRHPYTRGLVASRPRPGIARGHLPAIAGTAPAPDALPPGCAFHPRCPWAEPVCRGAVPPLELREDGRWTACFLDGALDRPLAAGAHA